jgi:endonuclease/exonuclease/phosphatase family metal-dependent hydrolase
LISRIAIRVRWLRRRISRTHWAARLFGIRTPEGEADDPGLIMIQIDGLSRTQLEKAVEKGNMPFLARLIRRNHFTLENFYSGVPSTTPAVQGEIFYGVRAAVPSFQFLRRDEGKILRMYEAEAAAEIEQEMLEKCPEPLLKDGHSYSNIYRAGSVRSRYCSQDLAPDELLKEMHPFKTMILSLVYAPRILRMIGLAILEAGLALVDAVKGLYAREGFFREMSFVPARVVVCIALREMIRFRVLLDVERGVQTIHANFLGYDEQSHRRGPSSDFAHWTLKGIDRAIRDIYRAANHSSYRDYELMIYSDHGQEATEPYERRYGRGLDVALGEVFARGPLDGAPVWMRKMPELLGNTLDRCRNLMGLKSRHQSSDGTPDPTKEIVVTAMGPIGHIYLPRKPGDPDMVDYAHALVNKAGIPLVMWGRPDGSVAAMNSRGLWAMPQDRAEVLGKEHPFLDEAGEDLTQLCHHPHAGDLVISGWDPQGKPLTFPMENGAHCGPGSEETRGFLLVPDRIRRWHLSHLARTADRVRGEDLRKIAIHFLGRDGVREERVPERIARGKDLPLRVMTYNIHSCMGIDGKIRPERVARVINHFDPDIVAVQEVDAHRSRSRGHDQAQLIADHLRMTHVFQTMLEEEKERYGIAVFARYPFKVLKAAHLTPADRRIFREARGAIWLQIEPEGGVPFHFINTHFGLGRNERRQQAEELLGQGWLGGVGEDEPVILCGDFNTGPRSPVFTRLQSRLRDAQLSVNGHKPRATFSSVKPLLRIDHVFVSRHFSVEAIERPDTPTAVMASDHLPLCVELTLHPNTP